MSATPAILAYVDGEPAWRPVKDTKLERAINTRAVELRPGHAEARYGLADVLGADACCDVTEQMAQSVLGELTNMIASQVALQLEPAEPVMMAPPTVERSTYEDWVTLDGSRDVVRLNVGGWPLLAMLSLRAA